MDVSIITGTYVGMKWSNLVSWMSIGCQSRPRKVSISVGTYGGMKWTNLLSSVNIGCQFLLGDDFDANILHIYEKDLFRSVPEHV